MENSMKNHKEIDLSPLGKTWILDLDGTLVKHNGYLLDGKDSWLQGAKSFLDAISEKDMVIFLTSRKKTYQKVTEQFLREEKIRYNMIIYEVPYGERILINDMKPSGLETALAINTTRDYFCEYNFHINNKI